MTARWIKAADHAALAAADGVLGMVLEGRAVALFLVGDAVHATADLCTHGAARLSDGFLDGHHIECPLHQGLFDVRDGSPAGAPCTIPIRSFPTRLENGDVFVALED